SAVVDCREQSLATYFDPRLVRHRPPRAPKRWAANRNRLRMLEVETVPERTTVPSMCPRRLTVQRAGTRPRRLAVHRPTKAFDTVVAGLFAKGRFQVSKTGGLPTSIPVVRISAWGAVRKP